MTTTTGKTFIGASHWYNRTMSQSITSPTTKPEAYNAYLNGNLTQAEAREFFGDEWSEVLQLERVDTILATQPEPDTDSANLFL